MHTCIPHLDDQTPASQTLIVPDTPPETIVFPSGANCTDVIASGSAFSTLESSFRLSALGCGGQEYEGGYQVEEFRHLGHLHPRLLLVPTSVLMAHLQMALWLAHGP